jgi:DNA-3-methyladenine glycosylase II
VSVLAPREVVNEPDGYTFEVEPIAPFRLDLTVWALRRRPQNSTDRWDGDTYRRALAVGDTNLAHEVAVTEVGSRSSPKLRVSVSGGGPETREEITRAIDRLLGLRVDLGDFYRFTRHEPPLSTLATRFRGVKPPRFATLFEGLANAVACQQLSLEVGVRLLDRLAREYGRPTVGDETAGIGHAFPLATDVADADPDALRALGFSHQKAAALIGLAESVANGELSLDRLQTMDNVQAAEVLRGQRGLGRWSAEYVLLRTLGRTDVFPGDDVGARNKLQRWLGLDSPPDYDEIRTALAHWDPFAGLVYFHLLLDGLAVSGRL